MLFLEQLYDRGLIPSRACSFSLGTPDRSSNGSIVIAGVDRAKSTGDVVVQNMTDPFQGSDEDGYLNRVDYSSIVSRFSPDKSAL